MGSERAERRKPNKCAVATISAAGCAKAATNRSSTRKNKNRLSDAISCARRAKAAADVFDRKHKYFHALLRFRLVFG